MKWATRDLNVRPLRPEIEALLNQVMKKKRVVLLELLEEQLGPGSEGTSGTGKKKGPYEKRDWADVVSTIQKTSVREALQAISFPPATKEQYEQLKAIVEQVPAFRKRAALQKKLEELEFESKTEDAS